MFSTNFVLTAAAVRNCLSQETSLKMTEIFIVKLVMGKVLDQRDMDLEEELEFYPWKKELE